MVSMKKFKKTKNMNHIKLFENFINEGYYDDIDGFVSTADNKSGFKDGDDVKDTHGQVGKVYDVLVSPDRKRTVVVVKWEKNGMKTIGKYGDGFNDINQISLK